MTPALAMTGSTMTAAIRPACAAKASVTAVGSLKGSTIVVAATACRDAGAARDRQRRDARARLDQQAVAVTVVRAGELHDEVAAGRGARQADRAHRGLGARTR